MCGCGTIRGMSRMDMGGQEEVVLSKDLKAE